MSDITLYSKSIDRVSELEKKVSEGKELTILDKASIAIISEDITNFSHLQNLAAFNKLLDTEPSPRMIKTHPIFKKIKYIPIRELEVMLREVFGIFQVKNQVTHVMANSVVTNLEVHVWHPVIGDWMVYAGVGAVPIELQKDAQPMEIEKINKTALQRNAPASAGYAFSNACKKIGRKFGSHVNSQEAELKATGIY